MRYTKTVLIAVALLMVFSFSIYSETHKLKSVGTCPLIKTKGMIATADQLKTLLEQNAEAVQKGFEGAGMGNLYPAFMEQVKTVAIEEKIMPLGQKFQWMLFCKGQARMDVEWAGKKPLAVFGLTIKQECKEYDFVIPKKCGNVAFIAERNIPPVCDLKVSPEKANIGDPITIDLSGSKCAVKYTVSIYHPQGTLLEKKDLTDSAQLQTNFKEPGDYFIEAEAFNPDGVASANMCKAQVYINYPPVCQLTVTPTEAYTGQPFVLDATGSSDKDGKVVKAAFKITGKDGQEVDAKDVPELKWEKVFEKSGVYKVSVQVTDDFNAVSSNDCQAELKVQKRFYALVEGGPMLAKGTYSGYIFARAGFSYLLSPDKFSLVMAAGPAVSITGAPFKTHLMANVLLNAHFDTLFVGAGLGFSTKVRDAIVKDGEMVNEWKAGLDIVGNIGVDVFKAFNKRGSIFGEIRIPIREDLGFEHGHAFLMGFRYQF